MTRDCPFPSRDSVGRVTAQRIESNEFFLWATIKNHHPRLSSLYAPVITTVQKIENVFQLKQLNNGRKKKKNVKNLYV